MKNLKLLENHQCFGGEQRVYTHDAHTTDCAMRFALYLPPQMVQKSCPVIYWLSGLTCTEQNFITKAGAQRVAAELGLILVIPDTSPRGIAQMATQDSEYLGEGAGFYINARQEPWVKHYQMENYITQELPQVVQELLPQMITAMGIFGHSMGGHGALTLALKNQQQYQSVSALAPICAPSQTTWGQHVFQAYLGEDPDTWNNSDASALIKQYGWQHGEILIDQGQEDEYLHEQLKPHIFAQACEEAKVPLRLRMHKGYDHSYYFVATFIEDHLNFHATALMN